VYRRTQSAHERSTLPAPTGRKRTLAERMNLGEARYADELDARADVVAWWYEGLSWRLADDTRYVPDFVVLLRDGTLEAHEVKGATRRKGESASDFGVTEDAGVKLKVAAEQAPFPIVVVWQDRGTWQERRL